MGQNVQWGPTGGVYPSILAIGDSWFWYPFPGGSLINQLGHLVESREHIVLALGYNGAEAVDYTHGKYSKTIRTMLEMHGKSLSAVFISGGGNDFAGVNDLRPMLNDDCSAAKNVPACFKPDDGMHTLDWVMRKLTESYQVLIGQVIAAGLPGTKIFLHNYDYGLPTGTGVFGKESSWLRKSLDDAQVPAKLQAACVRHVIDRLTTELKKLTQIDPQRIVLIDSRGCLSASDWANELHPTPAGFELIAKTRWLPALQRAGLAG